MSTNAEESYYNDKYDAIVANEFTYLETSQTKLTASIVHACCGSLSSLSSVLVLSIIYRSKIGLRNLRLHLILCDWVVNPPNAKGYDIYSIRRKQLWELHNKRYTGILRPLLLGSNDFFSLWLVLLLLVHYSVPDVEEEVWDASRTIHSYRRPMLPLADRFEFSVDKG